MTRIPVLVIGAGQAGLAMSHFLTRHAIGHVVLERGCIGERWLSERWDSLRLLTPNWASGLPGGGFQSQDPTGFMTVRAFADYLAEYARATAAPVQRGTAVCAVRPSARGYFVKTDRGDWEADAVVLATGHCDIPAVPRMAQRLPNGIAQVTPSTYRNTQGLPAGGVLVVGASATGLQIAEEIQLGGGRPVTLAVGCHTRMPRRYRDHDVWYWLCAIGVLDDLWHEVKDIDRARRQPSFQLVGRADGKPLDLGSLRDIGVRMTGRLSDIDGAHVQLADDLDATLTASQAALEKLLARIDTFADAAAAPAAPAAAPAIVLPPAPTSLDLAAENIRSVVWATGYRRDYAWLQVPVLNDIGEIEHEGGIASAPGLYALGLRFMRRRRSNFIDGVGRDVEDLGKHIIQYLAGQSVRRLSQAA